MLVLFNNIPVNPNKGGDANLYHSVLRDYQREAVDFMCQHNSYIKQGNTIAAALEYDDMG